MKSPGTPVLSHSSRGSKVYAHEAQGPRGFPPELNLLHYHHPILSLDVYDTNLHRTFVSPIHLFGEVESHARRLHGVKTARGLARLRPKSSSVHAANKRLRPQDREDIRYADIQRQLRLLRASADPAALEAFSAQEPLIERTRVRANPEILALFNATRQGGRRGGLISKMYFSGETFAAALRGSDCAELDSPKVSTYTRRSNQRNPPSGASSPTAGKKRPKSST
jgi:hypothetical protein